MFAVYPFTSAGGLDTHGLRPGWAWFISYLIVLFPPLDIISAFPLNAATLTLSPCSPAVCRSAFLRRTTPAASATATSRWAWSSSPPSGLSRCSYFPTGMIQVWKATRPLPRSSCCASGEVSSTDSLQLPSVHRCCTSVPDGACTRLFVTFLFFSSKPTPSVFQRLPVLVKREQNVSGHVAKRVWVV